MSIEIYQMPKIISSRQLKAALALLGWKVSELAEASRVSEPTIWRLETAGGSIGGRPETAEKLIGTLERAGIIFIEEDVQGPGVRLRKTGATPATQPDGASKPARRAKTAARKKTHQRAR
jgi:transcriptional regulator with XRE-family HTH domain